MSVIELLSDLRGRGIQVWVSDGALRYRAPDGALTAQLRDRVAQQRAELVAFLDGHVTTTRDGHVSPTVRGPVALAHEGATRPLSIAQERLWLLDQLQPGNPAYNMPAAVRLRGLLDRAALTRSVNEIVARHEVLRSTFTAPAGKPVQTVAPVVTIPLVEHDLSGLAPAEQEQRIEEHAAREAAAPFDLTRGPLLRTTVLRLGAEEHVLLLTVHHIVSDGWSMRIVINELNARYSAHVSGLTPDLPELAVQYADFAHWQREQLDSAAVQAQVAYWRERFATPAPRLDLPLDRPRPTEQTYRGGQATGALTTELSAAVRALAHGEGATLFMTLLGVFQVLLCRQSGQDEVVVGVPDAGRTHAEVEHLIGCFLNSVPVRQRVDAAASLREHLRAVRSETLEAYAHRDVPFERILMEVQPERRTDSSPLFQVFCNLVPFDRTELRLPGLTAEFIDSPELAAKFDLTLYATDTAAIELTLAYNRDLIDPARAEDLLAQYQALLAAAVAEPDRPLRELAVVTPLSRRVLPDPTEALVAQPYRPILDAVLGQAARVPDRVAVSDPTDQWTYAQLCDRAGQLAHHLREQGIGRDDVVAIHAGRGVSLVWAMLGVLGAGAGFLVVDPDHPSARILTYVDVARPVGWIQADGVEPDPAVVEALERASVHVVRLPAPSRADAAGWIADRSTSIPEAAPAPDAIASIMFTSGSTGDPKAVIGPHGPLADFIAWYPVHFGLTEADRFSLVSAPGHDPSLRDILTPLTIGATLCIPDFAGLRSGELARWVRDAGVTVANLTPGMLELLLTGAADVRADALRYACFGGDRLRQRHLESLRAFAPNARMVNFYGATETPQAVAFHDATNGPDPVPIGTGRPAVQLLVVGDEHRLAAVGELGEIVVRTPHLAAGYLGAGRGAGDGFGPNPFATADADRCYRTGDLGRYRPDGTVEFVGRADRQVKVRGFRVEPAEIEAVLSTHATVAECAVAAVAEADTEEHRLIAYVAPAAGATLTVAELREHLRVRLPAYLVPAGFVSLPWLPRLATGKLDWRSLPQPGLDETTAATAYAAPEGHVQEVLVRIWMDVLSVPRVGINDDFFSLGGHSLLATLISHRVREELGVDLPIRALFQASTVAQLAVEVERCLARPQKLSARIEPRKRGQASLDDLFAQLDEVVAAEGVAAGGDAP